MEWQRVWRRSRDDVDACTTYVTRASSFRHLRTGWFVAVTAWMGMRVFGWRRLVSSERPKSGVVGLICWFCIDGAVMYGVHCVHFSVYVQDAQCAAPSTPLAQHASHKHRDRAACTQKRS